MEIATFRGVRTPKPLKRLTKNFAWFLVFLSFSVSQNFARGKNIKIKLELASFCTLTTACRSIVVRSCSTTAPARPHNYRLRAVVVPGLCSRVRSRSRLLVRGRPKPFFSVSAETENVQTSRRRNRNRNRN